MANERAPACVVVQPVLSQPAGPVTDAVDGNVPPDAFKRSVSFGSAVSHRHGFCEAEKPVTSSPAGTPLNGPSVTA